MVTTSWNKMMVSCKLSLSSHNKMHTHAGMYEALHESLGCIDPLVGKIPEHKRGGEAAGDGDERGQMLTHSASAPMAIPEKSRVRTDRKSTTYARSEINLASSSTRASPMSPTEKSRMRHIPLPPPPPPPYPPPLRPNPNSDSANSQPGTPSQPVRRTVSMPMGSPTAQEGASTCSASSTSLHTWQMPSTSTVNSTSSNMSYVRITRNGVAASTGTGMSICQTTLHAKLGDVSVGLHVQ